MPTTCLLLIHPNLNSLQWTNVLDHDIGDNWAKTNYHKAPQ